MKSNCATPGEMPQYRMDEIQPAPLSTLSNMRERPFPEAYPRQRPRKKDLIQTESLEILGINDAQYLDFIPAIEHELIESRLLGGILTTIVAREALRTVVESIALDLRFSSQSREVSLDKDALANDCHRSIVRSGERKRSTPMDAGWGQRGDGLNRGTTARCHREVYHTSANDRGLATGIFRACLRSVRSSQKWMYFLGTK